MVDHDRPYAMPAFYIHKLEGNPKVILIPFVVTLERLVAHTDVGASGYDAIDAGIGVGRIEDLVEGGIHLEMFWYTSHFGISGGIVPINQNLVLQPVGEGQSEAWVGRRLLDATEHKSSQTDRVHPKRVETERCRLGTDLDGRIGKRGRG